MRQALQDASRCWGAGWCNALPLVAPGDKPNVLKENRTNGRLEEREREGGREGERERESERERETKDVEKMKKRTRDGREQWKKEEEMERGAGGRLPLKGLPS